MKSMDVYYYERQREKWWAWLVLIVIDLLLISGCIIQIGFGQPFGQNPMSNVGIIIITSALLVFSSLVLSGNIKIYINNDGVYLRYFPYHFRYKFYAWDNIRHIYVRNYHPIREYGGWGMRVSRWRLTVNSMHINQGIAYTISGRVGLQIELNNGKKILIGTQHPEELNKVLKKLGKID